MGQLANSDDISAAEAVLGVRLPEDYVDFLVKVGGREWTTDEAFVRLYDVRQLVERHKVTVEYQAGLHPGLVYIGDDGSRDGLGYDFRLGNPPLVLVEYTSSGWSEGLLQAPDFTTFLDRFGVSGWDYGTPYG